MPTIGMQTAAILQFIAMMLFLQPLMVLVLPHAAAARYYGTSGIVNGSYSSYLTNFQAPVLSQANSTSGFGANLLSNNVFGFVYGGLGLLWKSMINFPNMIWTIMTGVFSNLAFLPLAVVAGVSSVVFIMEAYVLISNFWKFVSGLQKTDMENVGA